MLTSQGLRASLMRTLTHPSFSRRLKAAAERYPALAELDDGAALMAFLEDEQLHSPARDRTLADLLRWGRDTEDTGARAAALFAFLPGAHAVLRRLACMGVTTSDELLVEALTTGVVALGKYDPDSRSESVLAGLELDVLQALTRNWKRAQRECPHTGMDAAAWSVSRRGSLRAADEPWADRPASKSSPDDLLDNDDVERGARILSNLMGAGALSQRDAFLMEGMLLRRRTATAIAAVTGMDRRTVVRRVDRALEQVEQPLRASLREEICDEDARFGIADGCRWVTGALRASDGVLR